MSNPEDELFDNFAIGQFQMDEEEAKDFRMAVLNINYETLYKPLWNRHFEFVRTTKRNYIILIVLLSVSIGLQIRHWLW